MNQEFKVCLDYIAALQLVSLDYMRPCLKIKTAGDSWVSERTGCSCR